MGSMGAVTYNSFSVGETSQWFMCIELIALGIYMSKAMLASGHGR